MPTTMKTLLYVDDDPNDRLLAETACERARVSFLLKTMDSGVDAFRYLSGSGAYADRAAHPLPDLIFLDLKMPEIDGFEVLRWARNRAETRTTPVAIYSASLIPEDIAKAYSLGANYFITKPSSLTVLLEIFRAADKCLADSWNGEALAPFSTLEMVKGSSSSVV
jgi:CheY-like chemotaxis protein